MNNKMVTNLGRAMSRGWKKHGKTIILATEILSFTGASISAIRATIKAYPKIMYVLDHRDRYEKPVVQIVKMTGKYYVTSLVLTSMGVGCALSNYKWASRANAALIATCSTFKEYKDTVSDVIGKEKEAQIATLSENKQKVRAQKAEKVPEKKNNPVITNRTETILCKESFSGMPFRSTKLELEEVRNKINSEMLKEGYVSLNDLYYELDMENTEAGYCNGWINNGQLVEFEYDYSAASDGTPCMVVRYSPSPMRI